MPSLTLQDLIEQADALSPAVQILPRLIELLHDENSNLYDICNLIKMDPSLVSRVLKLSNSAYFGMASSVVSLENAVNRLGQLEVYKIVALACGRSLLEKDLPAYGIEAAQLWENALGSAITMELLAKEDNTEADVAYTIGLLHNLGKIVINQFYDTGYEPVYQLIEQESLSQPEAERQIFGFDQAELCAALLESWAFPQAITEPIAHQYRPLSCPIYRQSACQLHLSWHIVASIGLNHGRAAWAVRSPELTDLRPDINEESFHVFVLKASQRFEDMKGALGATHE
jgi:HD-like signal output (HDOD) protein